MPDQAAQQPSQEDRLAVAIRLQERRNITVFLKRKRLLQRPLALERALLAVGFDLIGELKGDFPLSEKRICFAWTATVLELIDKTAATGVTIKGRAVDPTASGESVLVRRRFRRKDHPKLNTITCDIVQSGAPKITTRYTDAIGVQEAVYLDRRDNDLTDLHYLRSSLGRCLGLSPSEESCWTRLTFPLEQHELYGLVTDFINSHLIFKGYSEGYQQLCRQVDAGNIDRSMLLLGTLRYAVDSAMSDYDPDLTKSVFLTEGLWGGPPW